MFSIITQCPIAFILALIIGLITAWWIWGRSGANASGQSGDHGGGSATRGGVGGMAAKATGVAAGAAGAATGAVKAGATAAKDGASSAAGAATGAVKAGATAAKDGASSAAGAATGAAKSAGGTVKAGATAAKDGASSAAGAAKGAAKSAGSKAKSGATAAKAPAAGSKPKIAAAVGKPDDLTDINGVGPKLAAICDKLGIKRFDQIADWGKAEIAEVDEHLGQFRGRIERDSWVSQAKLLAAGKKDEWEKKFGYKK